MRRLAQRCPKLARRNGFSFINRHGRTKTDAQKSVEKEALKKRLRSARRLSCWFASDETKLCALVNLKSIIEPLLNSSNLLAGTNAFQFLQDQQF